MANGDDSFSEGSDGELLLSESTKRTLHSVRTVLTSHLLERGVRIPQGADPVPIGLGIMKITARGLHEEYPEFGVAASARMIMALHYLHTIQQKQWEVMQAELKERVPMLIAKQQKRLHEDHEGHLKEYDNIAKDILCKINHVNLLNDLQEILIMNLMNPRNMAAQVMITGNGEKKQLLEGLRDLMTSQGVDVNFAIKL